MLGNGLITEEVFTVQAAAELLEKTKHIVDAIHHGEAEKVLLPIKCGCGCKTGGPLETTSQSRSRFSHQLNHQTFNNACFLLSATSGKVFFFFKKKLLNK